MKDKIKEGHKKNLFELKRFHKALLKQILSLTWQEMAVQDLYNFFRRSKKIKVNLGNNKFKGFIFAMQVFLKPQNCNHRGHIVVPSQSI